MFRLLSRTLARISYVVSLVMVIAFFCFMAFADLSKEYKLSVKHPFITDPTKCKGLSLAEVKANLEIHGCYKREISGFGKKEDLKGRLKNLLEQRQDDIALKRLLHTEVEECF